MNCHLCNMYMIENIATGYILEQHRLPKTTNSWGELTFYCVHVEADDSSTTSIVSEISPYSQEVGPKSPEVGPKLLEVGPKSPKVGQKALEVDPKSPKVGVETPEVDVEMPEVGVEMLKVGRVAICDGSSRYDDGLQSPSLEDADLAVNMNVYRAKTWAKNAANVALNIDDGVSGQNDVALYVALNRKLVALVKANSGINRMQLSEKLSVTTRTIDKVLASLEDAVVRRGSKKTGGYYCKDEPLA